MIGTGPGLKRALAGGKTLLVDITGGSPRYFIEGDTVSAAAFNALKDELEPDIPGMFDKVPPTTYRLRGGQ